MYFSLYSISNSYLSEDWCKEIYLTNDDDGGGYDDDDDTIQMYYLLIHCCFAVDYACKITCYSPVVDYSLTRNPVLRLVP